MTTCPTRSPPRCGEEYRKRQDEEHRRCAKAALEDNKYHVTKADVTNHGDTTANEWKEVKTPADLKAKDKRGNFIIAAEGGLALTVLTDGHAHAPADEDERPSLGYKMNEDKKTIKHETEKSNPVENRSPDTQPESDKNDEMPVEQRLPDCWDAALRG